MSEAASKRELGQYFTETNPFLLEPFRKWVAQVPQNTVVLEPYAGANNLIRMLQEIGYAEEFKSYDIEPQDPSVQQRDTIADYPNGFTLAVTNPPYLAKNSATRRGIEVVLGTYDDLYKVCIDLCLKNSPYVGAIIPESFITSGEFQDRLQGVVSLTAKMFSDTECPVCLALWGPNSTRDFTLFRGEVKLGKYTELRQLLPLPADLTFSCKFNDPAGPLGLRAIDGTKGASIRFCPGHEIDSKDIKISSRSLTRISGDFEVSNSFIEHCNLEVEKMREATSDVFLTSFKGLREDGAYRRRLDFKLAKDIIWAVAQALRDR